MLGDDFAPSLNSKKVGTVSQTSNQRLGRGVPERKILTVGFVTYQVDVEDENGRDEITLLESESGSGTAKSMKNVLAPC